MKRNIVLLYFLAIGYCSHSQSLTVSEIAQKGAFPLITARSQAVLYTDTTDAQVVQIAAKAFQQDVQQLTQQTLPLQHTTSFISQYVLLIGTIGQSAAIDQLIATGKLNVSHMRGQWENFTIQPISFQTDGRTVQALAIAGSDRRGTAYGVFELSRRIGVSPWCWWADVTPMHKKALYIGGRYTSTTPSVQFRGIFLNDEDWGLQPWAAQQMDTAVHDIGPATYTRIFELLLRLKANYIWPAMHPCTKAFYHYIQNPQLADQYAIVVGSSHCEPMLRNNVYEWNEGFAEEYGHKPGEWRYDVNKNEIYQYWKDRVEQSKQYESVYTVGMRGIHDGSMPGPKNPDEKLQLLENIIKDQRYLLQASFKRDASGIPQIFCPYKEVLTLYQRGLPLPGDVTIVWADDNHGYVRQLSTPEEQKRTGGSGVYYHVSYWGAPADYLWLSTISPSLMSFELTKAWQYNARKLWVINVGDIKPAEMETQFAMDLAWDINAWPPDKAQDYTASWAAETFGATYAADIAAIKKEYYRLAAAAKPEHLNMRPFTLAEGEQRLQEYEKIAKLSTALYQRMPAALKDAFFELVQYPVQGAYLMNQKIVLAKKSLLEKDPTTAFRDADQATKAFEQIRQLTDIYNHQIAHGKWDGIMSWQPRKQAVFNMPPTARNKPTDNSLITDTGSTTQPLQVLSAVSFTSKEVKNKNNIQTIPGLGYTGQGVTCLPFTAPSLSGTDWINASSVTFSTTLPAGSRTIQVRCLPTHRQHAGRGVRYAISVNNDAPQVVELETPTDNAQWKENVLRGYAQGSTIHTVQQGNATIKVYFLDPGLVLSDIKVY